MNQKKHPWQLFETKAGRIALFIWRLGQGPGYKSALDDITGYYLFGTTESKNNRYKKPRSTGSGLKKFSTLSHSHIFFKCWKNNKNYLLDFILGFVFKNYLFLMQFPFGTSPKLKITRPKKIDNVQKILMRATQNMYWALYSKFIFVSCNDYLFPLTQAQI